MIEIWWFPAFHEAKLKLSGIDVHGIRNTFQPGGKKIDNGKVG
jgi:hypothetical protein